MGRGKARGHGAGGDERRAAPRSGAAAVAGRGENAGGDQRALPRAAAAAVAGRGEGAGGDERAAARAAAATVADAQQPADYQIAPAAALPRRPGRSRWLDVLGAILRYIRGVGRGADRLLRLLMRRGINDGVDGNGDGDIGDDGVGGNGTGDMGDRGGVLDTDLPGAEQKRVHCAWMFRDPLPSRLRGVNHNKNRGEVKNNEEGAQNPPHLRPFLTVGNYTVYKEERDLYQTYCLERPSGKNQLCHFCIFEQCYFYNKLIPSCMLKHCIQKHHEAGMECPEAGCRVRVSTERDRAMHIFFCHTLPPVWWEMEQYRLDD